MKNPDDAGQATDWRAPTITAQVHPMITDTPIAATELQDAPCFYCGKSTRLFAADPGEWPLYFCQPDGTGITRSHHTRCVTDRLAATPAAGIREALEGLTSAMRFVLAFYEPGQRHLDTEAWKNAEAGARAAFKNAEAALRSQPDGEGLREALERIRDFPYVGRMAAQKMIGIAGEALSPSVTGRNGK